MPERRRSKSAPAQRAGDQAHWRVPMTISVPPDVKKQIEADAAADGRNTSNYLVQLYLRERERRKR